MKIKDLIEILKQYDEDYNVNIRTRPSANDNAEKEEYDIDIIKQINENTIVLENEELLTPLDNFAFSDCLKEHLEKKLKIDIEEEKLDEICKYMENHADEIIFDY